MRKATNSNVAEVEVEIDRPVDRGAKRNQIGNEKNSLSTGGTGGSMTVATNPSEGIWYLEHVTVHALGASPGIVRADVQVRDGSDNVITEQIADGSGGVADFYGHVVKTDWDIHVDVSQSDSTDYTVIATPVVRKPSPSPSQTTTDPDDDLTLDSFERSTPLSEYSGATGDWATTTSTVYHNSTAVEYTANGDGVSDFIVTTSGLENYPDYPAVIEGRVRTGDVLETGEQMGLVVGASATDGTSGGTDGVQVVVVPSEPDFKIVDNNTLDTTRDTLSEPFNTDEWYTISVDVDKSRTPTYDCDLKNESGTVVASVTLDTNVDGDGFGLFGRDSSNNTGHTMQYDYITES